jgi:hypothetical protein
MLVGWLILRVFLGFSKKEPAMRRGSDPVKCQQWAERLERFGKSDQTVAQFCRDEGVSSPSFYRWRQKLNGFNANKKKFAKRDRQQSKPSTFKPVRVSPPDVSFGVKIRLPNGTVIDLGSDLPTIEKIIGKVLDQTGTDAC